MSLSAQNEGDHHAERETRERREMDDVATSSGYEPSEQDIERQNLQSFPFDPLEDENSALTKVDTDRVISARLRPEDPRFEQYIEKRSQDLNEHFEKSQDTHEKSVPGAELVSSPAKQILQGGNPRRLADNSGLVDAEDDDTPQDEETGRDHRLVAEKIPWLLPAEPGRGEVSISRQTCICRSY